MQMSAEAVLSFIFAHQRHIKSMEAEGEKGSLRGSRRLAPQNF
jgi:hypothetical protein